MNYVHKVIKSPVGLLKLVACDQGLVAILWEHDKPDRVPLKESVLNEQHPVLCTAETQLSEYFEGQRKVFDVKLAAQGTEFQKKVWQALSKIPFGESRTYGQIAQSLGKPTASRAVGAANGRNPISIVVPCHRVIGTSGALTGFAGGLRNKSYLLNLEGIKFKG